MRREFQGKSFMAQLRWILVTIVILLLLPVAAAFLFPPRVILPVPEPSRLSPPIVYRLPPAKPNDLDGVAVKIQGDLVNLRVNTYHDTPGYALHSFIVALKTYPHVRRIRVSWSLLVFMNGMNSTVLYDRHRHTVALYSIGGGDVLGTYHDHFLFTSVREAVFARLAEAHRDDTNENAWGYFEDFPKYRCRQRDLGSWRKAPSHQPGRRRRASMATSSRRTSPAKSETAS
jgi:hypothetical protein